MKTYTCLLTDGTIGRVEESSIDFNDARNFIGDPITVQYRDSNGDTCEETGELAEVLLVEELT